MKVSILFLVLLITSVSFGQINKPINASSTLPSVPDLKNNLQFLLDSERGYPEKLPLSDIVSEPGNYPEYYKTAIHLVPNDRATITVYRNGLKKNAKYSAILGSYEAEDDSKQTYQNWQSLLNAAMPQYNTEITVVNKDYNAIMKRYLAIEGRTTVFTLMNYRAADELWYVVLNYNAIDNIDLALLDSKRINEESTKSTIYYQAISAMKAQAYCKACKLFIKNLKKDNADYRTHYQLGIIFRYGLGTPADIVKAQTYFEIAAKHDIAMASYEMGLLLKEQDKRSAALKWFEKAALQGSELGKLAFDYETEYQNTHLPDKVVNYSISSNASENTPVPTKKICTFCKGTGKLYNTGYHDKNQTCNPLGIYEESLTCFACNGNGHID